MCEPGGAQQAAVPHLSNAQLAVGTFAAVVGDLSASKGAFEASAVIDKTVIDAVTAEANVATQWHQ